LQCPLTTTYYQHMPNDTSHLTQSKRYYPGESECSDLIEWINKKKNVDSGKRVIQLLTEIKTFYSLTAPSPKSLRFVDLPGRRHVTARHLLAKDAGQVKPSLKSLKLINKTLANYWAFPQLGLAYEFGWDLHWEPFFGRRVKASRDVFEEALRVLQLVHLAEGGFLMRVDSCPSCSKWFFARFRHQKFCSKVCQQKHYWRSPEWKAHRRTYLSKYRKTKLLPNVK
jgi:hypothetical protein